ncbi:anti-sigma factor [Oscillibacter sp. MSJ-31]|uniref:anti-sigma factor family protein n=1 Tax=Oscillibacter sp. MSJ-31 TaxID=2841526 RepID=UPI001C118BA5|nr:zf-HC2 domain-containing protein [Oscillibacter sp. MSJ-31]MBU5457804.1 zf-HC2 domain-containing protein [Oscillibacter sp. MSJ-31]
MKKCEEFAPLLSAYFDGELTEEENAAVRAHLGECEDCRARLDEYAQLSGAMLALGDEDVPEGFTARVMDAVRAEKAAMPRMKKPSAWRRWMPMAACAAIVALAAAVTIPRTEMKQETTSAAPDTPAAQEDQAMFSMAAPPSDPLPDTDAEVEYPEQRCETVQSSPYYDHQLGGAAADRAKIAGASDGTENGSPEQEYYCETVPIGESGEEGSLLTAWYDPVVLELYGAGATDYVLSSGGVKDGDAGFYYAPIAALRDLPEGLGMRQAQVETLALAPADAEWVLVYPNDFSEVPQP